ncbi:membrane integrity-associated transporter subunit PqiC [Caballeronia sp. EK]|jgi:cholesterol transport system auxiliary component|uniref:ABC-type transport auxiliary lipoprotein family protein n=1 Tax=Caballeronia sp. EK TaxID=2767469 RepID=UPI001654C438|nr:ABC-type transport auxiliary lipoprotein family protein [Caballeronia sp. EK]MBC8641720.1 membrane integrity-associated transporter subunit PqiC [Caballeronia sp. EK]
MADIDMKGAVAAFALACVTLLAGCGSTPTAMPNAHYDLGAPPAFDATANSLPMPPVKVLAVGAPRSLETDSFAYRLSYVDAQRTGNYSDSHWTMPPGQLLTQRLRDALAARGPILSGADPVRAVPLLEVELTSFEQVFDAPEQSHGLVSVRATLTQQGRVIGQRSFAASAPAPSADASGGARALAAASDDVIAQLSAWLAAQPLSASR